MEDKFSKLRMVDDDGPWYDRVIEEFDREHRAHAIENRKHVVAMSMRGHGANDFPYDLDQVSMRTKDTSSLCGLVRSLSMWMWERLPVGHPVFKNPDKSNPNPHEGLHDQDSYHRPTIAYYLDQVCVYTGSSHLRYKCYVNELDTLTVEQVFWWPYENDRDFNLNEMCTRDNLLWRARCPMVQSKEQSRYIELGEQTPSMDGNVESGRDCYKLKLKFGWTQEEWSELVSEDPSAVEEEEEETQEEQAQENFVDIDVAQPSQPSHPTKKKKGKDKTPRVPRKKTLNSRFCSPGYTRKLLPKGMVREDMEESSEEDEEEEGEADEESSKEEEEEVPTRKGKPTKRGRRK
ncbi:hypothetical protein D1007_07709 [Hordeum vulgare]|nr:hypothetical protein D1007_07709 [Hordeum vulgare]